VRLRRGVSVPALLLGWERYPSQPSFCGDRAFPGMGSLDDSLVAEVANRLGIFCYSFLDYDRAIEQFRGRLSQRPNAPAMPGRLTAELHNIADALLLAVPPGPGISRRDSRYDRSERTRLGRGRALLEPPARECPAE